METKLENLIEKLKKEGIDEAKKESDRIVKEAKRKAEKALKDAEKKAAAMLDKARQDAAEFQRNGEIAIKQAARDSELAFRSRLIEMLDSVFRREVSASLSPDFVKTMILELMKQWGAGKAFEVTVHDKDKKQIEKLLFDGVNKALKSSVEILGSDDVTGGFRIGLKDDNVYYDFTDAAIASMYKSYLNPRIREILDGDDG
jgi:V/A-type H+-transporting ATPase subunit E